MKTRVLRFVGFVSLVVGLILILNSFSRVTGFTIIDSIGEETSSIAGIILFIAGILLLSTSRVAENPLEQKTGEDKKIARIRGEIEQTLRSGSVGTERDLRYIATKLGYNLVEGGNHTSVYNGDRLVTQIPRHSGDLKKGTYRGILSSLYDESERVA